MILGMGRKQQTEQSYECKCDMSMKMGIGSSEREFWVIELGNMAYKIITVNY